MGRLSKQAKAYFMACGKKGGAQRKKRLSATQRSHIAKLAARKRWGLTTSTQEQIQSIRLESPSWSNPVYLEEILLEGSLQEWQTLCRLISEHPFGDVAHALETVVISTHIYGATNLWGSLLKGLRGTHE